MHANIPLLVILGPTASGKTHLAVHVAHCLDGEIISADSRQVYRGMTIGTGKDLDEYQFGGQAIPYHLIDILNAGERYNVSRFQEDFRKASAGVTSRGKVPVVCGGTGMYIEAILKDYAFTQIPVNEVLRQALELLPTDALLSRFELLDTAHTSIADTSTRKRLIRAIEIGEHLSENGASETTEPLSRQASICFGLNPPVEERRKRITRRLAERFDHGLIEEVAALLQSGISAEDLMYYGLEYKWITMYLTGEMGLAQMKIKLETEIHRFAKRQMTFFRKMEKDGIHIHWLDASLSVEEMAKQVKEVYKTLLKNG